MKGPATVQERVERARSPALRQLQFVLNGGDLHNFDVMASARLAVQAYRLKFPGCRATDTWLFSDGGPLHAPIPENPERVDVYCLFCRVILVNKAIWQHDYTEQLRSHTTVCALRSLAGLLDPGAPGTYRLPSEVP